MPALNVLGRRWHIAADDLPIPSFVGAAWHFSWFVPISLGLAYLINQVERETCPQWNRHIAFFSVHFFCFLVNGILHAWTFFESRQGTLFQAHRRRRVGPLVVVVMCFYLLTVGNTVFGTRIAHELQWQARCITKPGSLHLDYNTLLRVIVILTWVAMLVGFLALFITYNIFPAYSAVSTWQARCNIFRYMCCCCLVPPIKWLCGLRGQDARDGKVEDQQRSQAQNLSPAIVIANIFLEVFGTVDMTLTDHMAAFTLVGARHRYTKPALLYGNAEPPTWLGEGHAPVEGTGHHRHHHLHHHLCLHPMKPPVVVKLAVSGRHDGAGNGGSANGKANGAPTPGGNSASPATSTAATTTTATSIFTTSPPQSVFTTAVAAANAVIDSQGPASLATREQQRAYGAAASTAPATPATGVAEPAKAHGAAAGVATIADGAAQGLGSTAAGMHEEAAQLAYDVSQLGNRLNRVLSSATSKVFGTPPLLSGEIPALVDPRREWDGRLAEANVGLEAFEEALYYMRFATAVYGWKMFLWVNRLKVHRCCRLCVGRSCGCCRQSAYFVPSEMGCCTAVKLMEREAITQLTGVKDEDILFVCYKNRVEGLLPYYIAVDRARQSVVVAVRGSLSLRDVVTDLLCEPARMDIPGVADKDENGKHVLWAHRGILESTRAILQDIEEQGVLEAALVEWPAEPEARERVLARLKSDRARSVARHNGGAFAGWRLVVTGHSLGGGVAGLLGPYLRAKYPNLRAWAFAPPGGLMSPQAAALTREYCISVIHCKDMIPRLSISAMEQLVQELVTAGAHAKKSKLSIVLSIMFRGQQPLQEKLFRSFEELTAEQKEVLVSYTKNIQNCRVGTQFDAARNFIPPGHLLYVERHKPMPVPPACGMCCACNLCLVDTNYKMYDYSCRWIQVRDLMSCGLVVSRSMFLDHLPDNTLRAMDLAYNQMQAAQGLAIRKHEKSRAVARNAWAKAAAAAAVQVAASKAAKVGAEPAAAAKASSAWAKVGAAAAVQVAAAKAAKAGLEPDAAAKAAEGKEGAAAGVAASPSEIALTVLPPSEMAAVGTRAAAGAAAGAGAGEVRPAAAEAVRNGGADLTTGCEAV